MQEKGKNDIVSNELQYPQAKGGRLAAAGDVEIEIVIVLLLLVHGTVYFVNIVSQDAPFIVLMLYLSIKTMNDLQCFYSSSGLGLKKHTVFVLISIWTHLFTCSFTVVDCVLKVFPPLQCLNVTGERGNTSKQSLF